VLHGQLAFNPKAHRRTCAPFADHLGAPSRTDVLVVIPLVRFIFEHDVRLILQVRFLSFTNQQVADVTLRVWLLVDQSHEDQRRRVTYGFSDVIQFSADLRDPGRQRLIVHTWFRSDQELAPDVDHLLMQLNLTLIEAERGQGRIREAAVAGKVLPLVAYRLLVVVVQAIALIGLSGH
jgi:hypothetical protein